MEYGSIGDTGFWARRCGDLLVFRLVWILWDVNWRTIPIWSAWWILWEEYTLRGIHLVQWTWLSCRELLPSISETGAFLRHSVVIIPKMTDVTFDCWIWWRWTWRFWVRMFNQYGKQWRKLGSMNSEHGRVVNQKEEDTASIRTIWLLASSREGDPSWFDVENLPRCIESLTIQGRWIQRLCGILRSQKLFSCFWALSRRILAEYDICNTRSLLPTCPIVLPKGQIVYRFLQYHRLEATYPISELSLFYQELNISMLSCADDKWNGHAPYRYDLGSEGIWERIFSGRLASPRSPMAIPGPFWIIYEGDGVFRILYERADRVWRQRLPLDLA